VTYHREAMPDVLPALSTDELFARLGAGHASGITVVTPNRRLAQALAAEFDRRQVAAGRSAWETGDFLPFGALVERLYDDALHSDLAVPLLLGADQELSLWEETVRRSDAAAQLLAVAETAAAAAEAWQLAHAWALADRLGRAPLDGDAGAFAEWAREYSARTARAGATDRARLPAVVAGALDHAWVTKPEQLVAYGFDIVTPQQREFLAALAGRGVTLAQCGPPPRNASAMRVAALDAADEIRLAARWARARLESNRDARIAIVVPDLAARKGALRRVLAQTMDPGRTAGVLPFNVSLGDPLGGHPLVAHALTGLALAGREIEFERASQLVRSPFIGGAESELHARARLDARLRRRAEPMITLDRLATMAEAAPVLARTLAAYAEFRKRRLFDPRSPGDWARAFDEALKVLGFPGERALDSAEFQALGKWHELLARLASLDRVVARMRFGEALARLGRMAADTLFQPETPEVPIQVLGVLEAAGMTFDHLWVMGLADEIWPPPAHPTPFVPLPAQRAAGVPNASPSTVLELAHRLTAQWLAAAGEVVLSHPRREADRDLAMSPLVAGVAEGRLDLPAYPAWRDTIHAARSEERIPDASAPAPATTVAMRGGAALVKDQSACPFRAFARHRLRAEGIAAPHTGLDAVERGTLVHRVLAIAWQRLGGRRALDASGPEAVQALLESAAADAVAEKRRERPTTLAGRFAAIERSRLVRLALDWLDLDRARADFTVLATEIERQIAPGPLQLAVRLDRLDETAAGERVVIDYKTGRAALPDLLGPRPEEPQLPLYLVAAEPGAAAVAFAQVRAGDMKFVGLARDEGVLPGVRAPAQAVRSGAETDWSAQLAAWRAEIERLARAFGDGDAAVDPKRPAHTCLACGLHALCRIDERGAGVAEADE
jgi:probable DNA repair protein